MSEVQVFVTCKIPEPPQALRNADNQLPGLPGGRGVGVEREALLDGVRRCHVLLPLQDRVRSHAFILTSGSASSAGRTFDSG
jgi:hypothetical protein